MSYAITGASGQLGRLVTETLLGLVDPNDVVLITRDPGRLDGLEALARRGVSVRVGDFDQPDGLAGAFAGVERLLMLSTDSVGARLRGHLAAVSAARDAGVAQLLYTSLPRPDSPNPALPAPDHSATEQAIRASGLRWTFLRNNLYSEMQVARIRAAARTGLLATNSGSGGTAYVSRADCASVAARVLAADPGDFADQAIDVTGPVAVTAENMAELAARVGGRPVEVVHLDDDAFTEQLTGTGLPAEVAATVASFGSAARQGFLNATTETVRSVTGQAPIDLAGVVAAAQPS